MSADRDRGEAFLDALFGDGMGARHSRFVDRLGSASLRDALDRYHALEADTTHLSVEENYLLGVVVLCALGRYAPASMFAKTLRHHGVPAEKILAAVGRLEMWIGGVPAAEACAHVQKALREYDRHGLDSMAGWFPEAA